MLVSFRCEASFFLFWEKLTYASTFLIKNTAKRENPQLTKISGACEDSGWIQVKNLHIIIRVPECQTVCNQGSGLMGQTQSVPDGQLGEYNGDNQAISSSHLLKR